MSCSPQLVHKGSTSSTHRFALSVLVYLCPSRCLSFTKLGPSFGWVRWVLTDCFQQEDTRQCSRSQFDGSFFIKQTKARRFYYRAVNSKRRDGQMDRVRVTPEFSPSRERYRCGWMCTCLWYGTQPRRQKSISRVV